MRSAFPVLALLFAVCCFPGCGKRETPVEEGIRTKTLLVGNQNEPATLDPHLMDAATDMNVVVALFEGLTAYDEIEPLDVCIERADRALYKAKASGRNCTVIRHVDVETGKETSAHAVPENAGAQHAAADQTQ